MFVVFNHLNGMFRSHHLIISDTILDYFYLADVCTRTTEYHIQSITGNFCPIAPPSARARLVTRQPELGRNSSC